LSAQCPQARPLAALVGGYALLALGFFVTGFLLRPMLAGDPPPQPSLERIRLPQPVPVPAFSLEEAAAGSGAAPYTRERLLNRWTLMYFGYAHCPDGCPAYLAVMAELAHSLDAAARPSPSAASTQLTQLVFVSIDPARDTPAALVTFLSAIDAGIVGLRGSESRVAALAGALGMLYARRPGGAGGGYLMDHPAMILLIDPSARLRAGFGMPGEVVGMAAQITAIMSEYDAGIDG
jgi:protein SCO1